MRHIKVVLTLFLCLCIVGQMVACGGSKNQSEQHEEINVVTVNSATAAIEHLESIGKSLGYSNALSELSEKSTQTVDGDSYYRLQQNYKGIPIHGRTAVLVTDESGTPIAITGNVLDVDDSVETTPTVADNIIQEQIEEYAQTILGFVDDNSTVAVMPMRELVWYVSTSEDTALAYCLQVYIAGDPYELVVDAHNGEIYKANYIINTESVTVGVAVNGHEYGVNIWKEEDGTYTGYDAERNIRLQSANGEKLKVIVIFEDQSGAYYLYDNDQGKWYDGDGNSIGVPDGEIKTTKFAFSTQEDTLGVTPVKFSSVEGFEEDAARMMCFLAVSDDYYTKVLARTGWSNSNEHTLEVVYNGTDSYQCSPVSGISMLSIEDSASLNTVTHELTHAMERSESRMDYSGESGAIMEALSDIFAEIVEYDWLGQCDWLFDGGLRNLIDPSLSTENGTAHPSVYLGEHWVNATGENDSVVVHYNNLNVS